jgi:hypothetical protein
MAMADITLARSWPPAIPATSQWLVRLAHHVAIRRRRARRNRYLTLIGRAPRRYRWLEALSGSMSRP